MRWFQKSLRSKLYLTRQKQAMNEIFIFSKIVMMAFNTHIPASFLLVKASLKRFCEATPSYLFIVLFWFLWNTNLRGLFNTKTILGKKTVVLLFNYLLGGWKTNTVPKSISPKVNLIVWLEFKLAYYNLSVQYFSHYATGILPFHISFHHHHVALPAWSSLTLSSHPSLSSIAPWRSSRLYPVLAQSCCI